MNGHLNGCSEAADGHEGPEGCIRHMMRWTNGNICGLTRRTREGTQYLASVAVIWTELIKLLVCVGAQAGECARTASQRGLGFREEAMHQTYEILGRSWPMLVPAALFVMQQVPTHFCSNASMQ